MILNLKVEIKASRATTLYSKACKFDATADLEELQIEKSSESPNDRVRFRLEHTLIQVIRSKKPTVLMIFDRIDEAP